MAFDMDDAIDRQEALVEKHDGNLKRARVELKSLRDVRARLKKEAERKGDVVESDPDVFPQASETTPESDEDGQGET
jgi:hypothetical protein|tara:strand:+ start:6015 stop:6245 length:231 start_codon:yes stop_codon:yes gene_type:complete